LKHYETNLQYPYSSKATISRVWQEGIVDLGDFEVLWVWEILTQQTKQNK
jgi:hypothetical protein